MWTHGVFNCLALNTLTSLAKIITSLLLDFLDRLWLFALHFLKNVCSSRKRGIYQLKLVHDDWRIHVFGRGDRVRNHSQGGHEESCAGSNKVSPLLLFSEEKKSLCGDPPVACCSFLYLHFSVRQFLVAVAVLRWGVQLVAVLVMLLEYLRSTRPVHFQHSFFKAYDKHIFLFTLGK